MSRIDRLIFLSVPGLRSRDIDPRITPTLYEWANTGALVELTPTFPCVTSCVQASMWTGCGPRQHGVIANGFFDRAARKVAFWVARNGVIAGEQIWDALSKRAPRLTSAVWHAQNIKDAAADYIITPEPIHEPDGSTKLWCYSKPEGTYQRLLERFDHFPLQHYWGPLAGIESSRWILDAAAWLAEEAAPNVHWIYLPHLDYAAQKYGPDSEQARASLRDLDELLVSFAARVRRLPGHDHVPFLVAGEYALTEVRRPVPLNRVLRKAGWLAVREKADGEYLDLHESRAFAMVDHQFAHVYIQEHDPRIAAEIADLLSSTSGVAAVYAGERRAAIGLLHERSGDIVVLADDDAWFAYPWWLDDAAAPPFARTVDIHAKPGYDPVELFFDPRTRGIPLDAALVRGSHGLPADAEARRTALVFSAPGPWIKAGKSYRDTDLKGLVLRTLTGAG